MQTFKMNTSYPEEFLRGDLVIYYPDTSDEEVAVYLGDPEDMSDGKTLGVREAFDVEVIRTGITNPQVVFNLFALDSIRENYFKVKNFPVLLDENDGLVFRGNLGGLLELLEGDI